MYTSFFIENNPIICDNDRYITRINATFHKNIQVVSIENKVTKNIDISIMRVLTLWMNLSIFHNAYSCNEIHKKFPKTKISKRMRL